MTIQLTETQAETLRHETASPVSVVDPHTNALWYLVSATEYQAIQEILDDERQQKAIRTVGFRNAAQRLREGE